MKITLTQCFTTLLMFFSPIIFAFDGTEISKEAIQERIHQELIDSKLILSIDHSSNYSIYDGHKIIPVVPRHIQSLRNNDFLKTDNSIPQYIAIISKKILPYLVSVQEFEDPSRGGGSTVQLSLLAGEYKNVEVVKVSHMSSLLSGTDIIRVNCMIEVEVNELGKLITEYTGDHWISKDFEMVYDGEELKYESAYEPNTLGNFKRTRFQTIGGRLLPPEIVSRDILTVMFDELGYSKNDINQIIKIHEFLPLLESLAKEASAEANLATLSYAYHFADMKDDALKVATKLEYDFLVKYINSDVDGNSQSPTYLMLESAPK